MMVILMLSNIEPINFRIKVVDDFCELIQSARVKSLERSLVIDDASRLYHLLIEDNAILFLEDFDTLEVVHSFFEPI